MARDRSFTWIAANGSATPLSDRSTGIWVLRGVTGLGRPTYAFDKQDYPDRPGYQLIGARGSGRQIFLPIEFSGQDRREMLLMKHTFIAKTDPEDGPGYLQIDDAGFRVRIQAIYSGGMEGDESASLTNDQDGDSWQKMGMTFDCVNPYFEVIPKTHYRWVYVPPAVNFFPMFPLTLSTSQILSGIPTRITNTGGKEATPVWTITGPGTQLILTNPGTGEKLQLDYTWAIGETITVDIANLLVTSNFNGNLAQYLTFDDFWTIPKGNTMISVVVQNADVTTGVDLNYSAMLEALI